MCPEVHPERAALGGSGDRQGGQRPGVVGASEASAGAVRGTFRPQEGRTILKENSFLFACLLVLT